MKAVTPQERNIMKFHNFGKLALAGTMAFSLAACSSGGEGGSGAGADGEVSV